MTTRPGATLITCMLRHGRGVDLIARLAEEKGIQSGNVTSGRGRGRGDGRRGLGVWTEIDILEVAVPAERAEEIFEFLYEASGVGEPHGGMMFQHSLARATPFALPESTPEAGS